MERQLCKLTSRGSKQTGISASSRVSERENPLAKVLHAVELLNAAAVEMDGDGGGNNFGQPTASDSPSADAPSSAGPRLLISGGFGAEFELLPKWAQMLEFETDRVHESYMKAFQGKRKSLAKSIFGTRESVFNTRDLLDDVTDSSASHVNSVWTIHPQSTQRLIWDTLSVIIIAWDLFVIPLQSFDLTVVEPVLTKADWCVSAFWTFDVIMSFRTGFFRTRSVEMDPKKVAINYAKTWMPLDLAIVVAEWVTYMTQAASGAGAARFQRLRILARYLRGMRSSKLKGHVSKMQGILRSFYFLLLFSLVKICVCLLYVCHFLACGWHAIGRSAPDGWVYKKNMTGDGFDVLVYSYMSACRWTLAQINGRTDVRDDRNMQERSYTTFCAFFAVIFYSLFISALTTRMVELMSMVADGQKGMNLLKTYLSRHKLSSNTSYFAKEYVKNHQFLQNEALTESALLDYLPDHLQWDLMYEVRAHALVCMPLMKDLDYNFRTPFRQMIATAVSNVYPRVLQILFEPAVPCKRVLFHKEGEVRYTLDMNYKDAMQGLLEGGKNTRFTRMMTWSSLNVEDASEFGTAVPRPACLSEAALWVNWKHNGALVSVTESHLLALDIETCFRVFAENADAEARASIYANSFAIKAKDLEIKDLMKPDFGALLKEETAIRPQRHSIYSTASCDPEEANSPEERRHSIHTTASSDHYFQDVASGCQEHRGEDTTIGICDQTWDSELPKSPRPECVLNLRSPRGVPQMPDAV